MFCKFCGAELPSEYETHCPNCGEPLEGVPKGRRNDVASAEKTCCRLMLIISAVGLFWAVTMAFMPFFTVKGGAYVGNFLKKVESDDSLVEADLMIDLFVILAICLMGAVAIFLEKNSSGIRQIVVGVLLAAAGAIVYLCDQGKVRESHEAIMQMNGSISPGYGLYYYMCGAALLTASGVAMMIIHYIYKNQKKT